ncbi:MAG: nitrous oxide reductase accessory protein NosL [Xanthomonadaceae bacterium]|jgi:copper chaperone NosL|nr:nitrous oxide reductase accessory protein NosL [Xanthomonadaceae bacterium]
MNILRVLPLILSLAACAPSGTHSEPGEIAADTQCELDGMILADYPGPKGQILYADGSTAWFCDTVELLSIYLNPEQIRRVNGAYTQDMAKTDWEAPSGHWIGIEQAYFVQDSSLLGSMGPTLASFASRADAEAFARKYGGKVLAFAEITPELVRLDGGVRHDSHM